MKPHKSSNFQLINVLDRKKQQQNYQDSQDDGEGQDHSRKDNKKRGKGCFSQKDLEETVHFYDWVSFEKGNQYILGHYQGTSQLGLELIKKTKNFKKVKCFGFFTILPTSTTLSQPPLPLTYSTPFYLLHIETGLYLASFFDTAHQHAIFDHMILKPTQDHRCIFKFKKQIKGASHHKRVELLLDSKKILNENLEELDLGVGSEKSGEYVAINANLRIFNCASGKYIELVKTEAFGNTSTNNSINSNVNNKTSQNPVSIPPTSPLPLHPTTKKPLQPPFNPSSSFHPLSPQPHPMTFIEQHTSNLWLSYNFDYFIIRLQKRSKEYNPVLLSNYDTVMIYNQFTNAYIGVKKRKGLVEVVNSGGGMEEKGGRWKEDGEGRKEEVDERDGRGNTYGVFSQTTPPPSSSYDPTKPTTLTSRILINPSYLSTKNCSIEQTSVYTFQPKNTISYLWKVFTRPYHFISNLKQKYKNTLAHPSLIKSRQVLYFQHVQSGLFMMKNENEGDNGETYVLCDDFDQADKDQKDESGRFMFRVQNLCVLRYSKEFVVPTSSPPSPFSFSPLSSHLQPINTSLPLTIDFQQQQFLLQKLPFHPRIHYFTHHFPTFLNLLISFLNNPKAIDDRIYLLKQKLTVMEMVYDKVVSAALKDVKDVDQGYYFLDNTVKLLKVIRLKMRGYELQAHDIRKMKEGGGHGEGISMKKKTNVILHSTPPIHPTSCYQKDHYTFTNTLHPYQQLFQLNTTIFSIIRPLIKKVLSFLSLVFGDQTVDIFQLINSDEKYVSLKETREGDRRRDGMGEGGGESQGRGQGGESGNRSIIIKKKNGSMIGSGNNNPNKKRLRNNSSSSFKSSTSSISSSTPFTDNPLPQPHNTSATIKSPFASSHQPTTKTTPSTQKQQCSSQLMRQLIKSLVHLMEIQPKSCVEILKLLGIEEPYEIVAQVNRKLERVEERLGEAGGTGGNVPSIPIGTTLRFHRHFQTLIYQQMYHSIKLINHIIEYFNQDLDYDWSKKLTYIESHFQVKTNNQNKSRQKDQKEERGGREGLKRKEEVMQLVIGYKKRQYKLSEVLAKTEKQNFRKVFRVARERMSEENDRDRRGENSKEVKESKESKESKERSPKPQSKDKHATFKKLQKSQTNVQPSRTSFFVDKQPLVRKNSSSSSQISRISLGPLIKDQRQQNHESLHKIKSKSNPNPHPNNPTTLPPNPLTLNPTTTLPPHTKKAYTFIPQQRNYFFQTLKQIAKLKLINLKSRTLPLLQLLPLSTQPSLHLTNYLSTFRDLPSLAFIMQIANNIEVSLLNSVDRTLGGGGNMSLMGNSRFVCCWGGKVREDTGLGGVLNFGVVREGDGDDDINVGEDNNSSSINNNSQYPMLLTQPTIQHLITASPFSLPSLHQIFPLLHLSPTSSIPPIYPRSTQKHPTAITQTQLFSQAMQGLKTFLISLEIFVSMGKWNWKGFKLVEGYVLGVCEEVVAVWGVKGGGGSFYGDARGCDGGGNMDMDGCEGESSNCTTSNISRSKPSYINSHSLQSPSNQSQSCQHQHSHQHPHTHTSPSCPTNPLSHLITSGIKDTMQSMMVELNQLLQILYIQKKRIMTYPYIEDAVEFFEAKELVRRYKGLIERSVLMVQEMPILTEMLEINMRLEESVSVFQLREKTDIGRAKGIRSEDQEYHRRSLMNPHPHYTANPYSKPLTLLPKTIQSTSSLVAYQQNEALLTWPYLAQEQILLFYPNQLQLYHQTFIKTSSTITLLTQLTLLLTTLQSLQPQQKLRNNLITSVQQKINTISINLHAISKLQGNKKVVKAFGLIQMVLAIVLNNTVLEKTAIKPFLEFLVEMRMWDVTLGEVYRVMVKGDFAGIAARGARRSQAQQPSQEGGNYSSAHFLLKNIPKQEFFVIMAKYLQENPSSYPLQSSSFYPSSSSSSSFSPFSSSSPSLLPTLLTPPLLQLLDYSPSQPYPSIMQKMSFLCMLIEITPSKQISRKVMNKLLIREDVQLYIEAMRTFKNYQYFCQNVKSVKVMLESKRLIQDKCGSVNPSSSNLAQHPNTPTHPSTSKTASIFSNTLNNPKIKKPLQLNERQEMTNEKRQEINKFVLIVTTIFRICKRDKKLVEEYFGLFLAFKEIVKIVKGNVAVLGYSYEFMKPLLVYMQCDDTIFSSSSSSSISSLSSPLSSSSPLNPSSTSTPPPPYPPTNTSHLLPYLTCLNDILSQHPLYLEQLQSYQSTSTFFLPFVEEDEVGGQEPHIEFNKEKIKKIASQIKNFNKKTYFWELLVWVPCYQKEEGVLVVLEKVIMNNLRGLVGADNNPTNSKANNLKANNLINPTPANPLTLLEPTLHRLLHSIYDTLLSLTTFLTPYPGPRYSRLQTRTKKLLQIITELFPTIDTSLMHMKSQKLKQTKDKQKEMGDNSRVIEQEDDDEEELGFVSSEEKIQKSHQSYMDRDRDGSDDSGSGNARRDNSRGKHHTRRVVMHEPIMRQNQAKRTLMILHPHPPINKDKQRQQKYNAQMVGYQFVTKLSTHQKLQSFIKLFQQHENQRRQSMDQQYARAGRQSRRQLSLFDRRGSTEEWMMGNFQQYLLDQGDDDESEDCVVVDDSEGGDKRVGGNTNNNNSNNNSNNNNNNSNNNSKVVVNTAKFGSNNNIKAKHLQNHNNNNNNKSNNPNKSRSTHHPNHPHPQSPSQHSSSTPSSSLNLKQKPSRSQLNDIEQSLANDTSNYSHHAIIVADNSLQEDTLVANPLGRMVRDREDGSVVGGGSSKVESLGLVGDNDIEDNDNDENDIENNENGRTPYGTIHPSKRHKKFLTKSAFTAQHPQSLKNFKRADYSHFYQTLKSFKYHQVLHLLKLVLFPHSPNDHQNELYYQLEKILLDFFGFNGTINLLFENIQTFLKLESQKNWEKERGYSTECGRGKGEGGDGGDGWGVGRGGVVGSRVGRIEEKEVITLTPHPPPMNPSIILTLITRGRPSTTHTLLSDFILHKKAQLLNRTTSSSIEQSTPLHTDKLHNPPTIRDVINEKNDDAGWSNGNDYEVLLELLEVCLEKTEGEEEIEGVHRQMKDDCYRDNNNTNYSNTSSNNNYNNTYDTDDDNNYSHFNNNNINNNIPFSSQPHHHHQSSPHHQSLTPILTNKLTKLKTITLILELIILQVKGQEGSQETRGGAYGNGNSGSRWSRRDDDDGGDKDKKTNDNMKMVLQELQEGIKRYVYQLVTHVSLVQLDQFEPTKQSSSSYNPPSIICSSTQTLVYQIKLLLLEKFFLFVAFLKHTTPTTTNPPHSTTINTIMRQILNFTIGDTMQLLLAQMGDNKEAENPLSGGMNLIDRNGWMEREAVHQPTSSLKISDIALLKTYLNTVSMVMKASEVRNPSTHPFQTMSYSQTLIIGSINHSLTTDLTSPNLKSLELISLLTTCFTSLQLFMNSISKIHFYHNSIAQEFVLRFCFITSKPNEDTHEEDFNLNVTLKLIQLEVHLYKLLFKDKTGVFGSYSHTYYLKYMMDSYDSEIKERDNLKIQQNLEDEKSVAHRYIVLMHLLIESLNFFHHIFYKINPFPSFQSNLFAQRKTFIEQSNKLQINTEELKEMYSHLQEIFAFVVVSPQKKNNKNKIEIATFPIFKEFMFVWKFSLVKLIRSFVDEEKRRGLMFGAVKVFMQQSSHTRKIKYYITKMSPIVCTLSQLFVFTVIFFHLFLPKMMWSVVIFQILLMVNIFFIIFTIFERSFPIVIMTQITLQNKRLIIVQITLYLIILLSPIAIALGANIYSFWDKRALPFLLFVFIFNRLEAFYSFFERHRKAILSIFTYLLTVFGVLLAFHCYSQFGIDSTFDVDKSLTLGDPLFSIGHHPFNFLNLLIVSPKPQYVMHPLIIFFHLMFFLSTILIISKASFHIMQSLQRANIDRETDKVRQCYLCSKKAQHLLQQHIRSHPLPPPPNPHPASSSSTPKNPLKQHTPTTPTTHQSNQNETLYLLTNKSKQLPQKQRAQLTHKILEIHIKERHGIFSYISYFCYLVDKKAEYLTEKERMVKERFLAKDVEVYL